MSTTRTEEWHAGHAEGYNAGEADLLEFVDDWVRQSCDMKHIDDHQMIALQYLLRALDRRAAH
ncbi:hypothetical protein [Microbacterium sp.]|uniref:hypothetical protein n=1 Tax=Microbacterium sp. TaxID=51671 RepID=UPI0039E55EEE